MVQVASTRASRKKSTCSILARPSNSMRALLISPAAISQTFHMQNGSFTGNIACIDCSSGLQQHQVCLLFGYRVGFYSMRNDGEFALFHPDIALTLRRSPDSHAEPPFNQEKGFTRHIRIVPDHDS